MMNYSMSQSVRTLKHSKSCLQLSRLSSVLLSVFLPVPSPNMGKRIRDDADTTSGPKDTPETSEKRAKGEIPRTLPWTKDNSAKTYQFIAEMEKLDNFKILFGKKEKTDVSKTPCGLALN